MSLLARESRSSVVPSGLVDMLARTDRGPRSVALSVTPTVAMRHATVSACVQLIANLGLLPVRAYVVEDGREVLAGQQPPLLLAPSANVDAAAWRRQVLLSWLTRGTAFGLVAGADRRGRPTMIELLPAECVTVEGDIHGPWTWRVRGRTVGRWPDGPLWVAAGLHQWPGSPVGVSPIEMALGAIGLGLAAEDFGRSWFRDGAVPSAILSTDQPIDKDTAEVIKSRFLDAVRGKREPAVLGAGLHYQALQVAANESQFLETLDRNSATVCRFFLVPGSEVGAPTGDSMTYANVESRDLALLTRTFQPWLARLEATLGVALGAPQTIPRADVSDLIRTDLRTRTTVDVMDIRAGIRSRDEVRATRGLGPTPGGDQYVAPSSSGGGV